MNSIPSHFPIFYILIIPAKNIETMYTDNIILNFPNESRVGNTGLYTLTLLRLIYIGNNCKENGNN